MYQPIIFLKFTRIIEYVTRITRILYNKGAKTHWDQGISTILRPEVINLVVRTTYDFLTTVVEHFYKKDYTLLPPQFVVSVPLWSGARNNWGGGTKQQTMIQNLILIAPLKEKARGKKTEMKMIWYGVNN